MLADVRRRDRARLHPQDLAAARGRRRAIVLDTDELYRRRRARGAAGAGWSRNGGCCDHDARAAVRPAARGRGRGSTTSRAGSAAGCWSRSTACTWTGRRAHPDRRPGRARRQPQRVHRRAAAVRTVSAPPVFWVKQEMFTGPRGLGAAPDRARSPVRRGSADRGPADRRRSRVLRGGGHDRRSSPKAPAGPGDVDGRPARRGLAGPHDRGHRACRWCAAARCARTGRPAVPPRVDVLVGKPVDRSGRRGPSRPDRRHRDRPGRIGRGWSANSIDRRSSTT